MTEQTQSLDVQQEHQKFIEDLGDWTRSHTCGQLTLDNNGDGYIVNTSATVNKAKDDIITIDNVGLAYSSDVKVFEYNKADSKFVSKTISSLKSANYDIYVQIDDSTVVGIYYIK